MKPLRETMIDLWQAACQDKGRRSCRVEDGHFVLEITGNRARWEEMTAAAGVPSQAVENIDGDTLTMRWPSHADAVFGADGLLAQALDKYEVRPQQLWMGRMVQRAIEMGQPAVIEAGAGTGKSFAYAAVCMAMGKKLVISTSNKALQMQLYQKDIPFLSTIFPGKKVALVQGKGNYACRAKAEDLVSGRFTIPNEELRRWYATTDSGNVEEIPFAVDWQELRELTADDQCLGKMCSRYGECFYYQAKEARKEADVLITNHMLLCMHQAYPGAGILPDPGVVVVDEAHKLADYARNVIGVEFQLRSVAKTLAKAEKHDASALSALEALEDYERELYILQRSAQDSQIGLRNEQVLNGGERLAGAMEATADEIWEAAVMPSTQEGALAAKDADAIRSMARNVREVSEATRKGFVRWIDQSDKDAIKLNSTPFDVSRFIGELAGFVQCDGDSEPLDHTRCTKCHRKLTAETVALLGGQPYGPDCILTVDIFGDAERVSLADWLAKDHEPAVGGEPPASQRSPVIFTSATLAAPNMSHFMRESGIPYALQMQVESPFNYRKNALLYVPNGTTPNPGSDEHLTYLVDDIRQLVRQAKGGAFLLFTSYRTLNHCVSELHYQFESWGYPVYVQGELPKLEIAKRFREQGNGVLFATKSFFEGVSIDGDALRLVVIDKMPFEAPSPLNTAQEEALREYAVTTLNLRGKQAEWYPFEALRVPKMTIELKQGAGRLIRTATDRGVIAILDPRLRSSRYGRNDVLPSLPPAPLVSSLLATEKFFAAYVPTPIVPTLPTLNGHKSNGHGRKETALFVEKVLNRDEDGELWA